MAKPSNLGCGALERRAVRHPHDISRLTTGGMSSSRKSSSGSGTSSSRTFRMFARFERRPAGQAGARGQIGVGARDGLRAVGALPVRIATGVDLTAKGVELTSRAARARGSDDRRESADVRQANSEALPFDDASFDHVYSVGRAATIRRTPRKAWRLALEGLSADVRQANAEELPFAGPRVLVRAAPFAEHAKGDRRSAAPGRYRDDHDLPPARLGAAHGLGGERTCEGSPAIGSPGDRRVSREPRHEGVHDPRGSPPLLPIRLRRHHHPPRPRRPAADAPEPEILVRRLSSALASIPAVAGANVGTWVGDESHRGGEEGLGKEGESSQDQGQHRDHAPSLSPVFPFGVDRVS